MWKDIKFKTYYQTAVAPQTVTADVNGLSVDTQDLNSLGFLVAVGTFTFTSTNRIDLQLQHSDDNSTWADVGQDQLYSGTAPIALSLVAATDDEKTHLVEYRGGKRYVRLVVNVGGTVSVLLSAVAVSLDPEKMPPL